MIHVVIVTYNGMQWIDRCLDSLMKSDTEVSAVVVDNASQDGTVQHISEHYPEVRIIAQGHNVGFAKANNIGIRYVLDNGARFVYLLNQDAWVEENVFSKLMKVFEEDPSAGIVSPVHFNGSGSALDMMFASYMPPVFVSDAFVGRVKDTYDVRFVNAASWLISRACLEKVGGFDTSLFVHYGEDDNFCQRVRYHGFRIVVNTTCAVFHDREQRSFSEEEYRHRIFRMPDLPRRVEMADINKDYDIPALIVEQRKLWWRKLLTFRIKATEKHKDEIEFLTMIGESRRINIVGGSNWL